VDWLAGDTADGGSVLSGVSRASVVVLSNELGGGGRTIRGVEEERIEGRLRPYNTDGPDDSTVARGDRLARDSDG